MDDDLLPVYEEPVLRVTLRGPQPGWVRQVEEDFQRYSRLLFVAVCGAGKSTIFAALAARFAARGIRTLVLANRDRLVRQSAGRIKNETGIDVGVEMGKFEASMDDMIVMASVQTMSRRNRLECWPDNHFGFVVADEAHFCLATTWARVLNYFHYGAGSLRDDWERPKDGAYHPKALICGFTATPRLPGEKTLMSVFQHVTVNYPFLDAVNDGWIVPPQELNIPVKVDISKARTRKTDMGTDFNAEDVGHAMEPVIEELADQIVIHAKNRKTLAFLPSVECAKMLNAALLVRGMQSMYVTGECLDKNEKTDLFQTWGPGSVLSNCCLHVYGIDMPTVDTVAWFKATLSPTHYCQGVQRPGRPLPGILDGLTTPESRRAAIAASAKPHFTILSPFFVSDRIDLCDPYDLFTDKPEVKKAMKATGLTPESAEKAERDFIEALKKEAKKHAQKEARMINPLAFSVWLGDEKVKNYKPATEAEAAPVSEAEKKILLGAGMNPNTCSCSGEAQIHIQTILTRANMGLAHPNHIKTLRQHTVQERVAYLLTRVPPDVAGAAQYIHPMKERLAYLQKHARPEQLELLEKVGYSDDRLMTMKRGQAGAIIGRLKQKWRNGD